MLLRPITIMASNVSRLACLVLAPLIQSDTAIGSESANILWSVDWSSDGSLFAVGGERTLWIFDAETHERLAWSPPDVADVAMAVRWHPLRNLLAVAGDRGVTGIYDVTTGQTIPLKTRHGARGITWNARGDRLATAGNDGSLQIWADDGTLLHTTRPESAKSLTGVAWHPKDKEVISVGEFITVYDQEGRTIRQVRHRPEAEGPCLLLCVAWHPSGEFFVVGDYGNNDTGDPPVLQYWSRDCHLLRSIPRDSGFEFRNISWTADGLALASASDALCIWDRAGRLQHQGASDDLLWGVCWNAAGDRLLTSSIEGRVTLWTDSAEVSTSVIQVAREDRPSPDHSAAPGTLRTEEEDANMKFGMQVVMNAQAGRGAELGALILQASKVVADAEGCEVYIVQASTTDTDKILVTEVWESKEAHQASLSMPEVREIISTARPLIESMEHDVAAPLGGKGL